MDISCLVAIAGLCSSSIRKEEKDAKTESIQNPDQKLPYKESFVQIVGEGKENATFQFKN